MKWEWVLALSFTDISDAYIISICEQINPPMNTENLKQQQKQINS